jgi:hypothetical protein
MEKIRTDRCTVLLCVCYLSQLVIAPAQPAGLGAAAQVLLFFLGTLLQLLLYRVLSRRCFFHGTAAGLTALLLCFAVGFDFVRAERFYRAITARQLSFWWIIGCMLLIGWYAAHCGYRTVLRAAQPVLVLLLLSLGVLAMTASGRPEALAFPQLREIPSVRAAQALLEYTCSTELLLWLYWHTYPQAAAVPKRTDTEAAAVETSGWRAVLWLRFAAAALLAVLGELTLGERAADTPQLAGVLSMVSTGADAGHGGAVYHCIWLTALAVRVGAHCCVRYGLVQQVLPRRTAGMRQLLCGVLLIGTAVLWEALWRQQLLLWLSAAVLLLAAAAVIGIGKNGGKRHEKYPDP